MVTESEFWDFIYILCSNQSSMLTNLRVIDKYDSNHRCDLQTDRKTRTEVRTVNIYRFVRSNVVTCGVTELRKFMKGVIIDRF